MPAQPNRGAPLPPHVNNQMTGFAPELNPLQAFPFGHRQPNFAGLGMRPPGKALTALISLCMLLFSLLRFFIFYFFLCNVTNYFPCVF